MIRKHLTYANIVATIALVMACTGTAIASRPSLKLVSGHGVAYAATRDQYGIITSYGGGFGLTACPSGYIAISGGLANAGSNDVTQTTSLGHAGRPNRKWMVAVASTSASSEAFSTQALCVLA